MLSPTDKERVARSLAEAICDAVEAHKIIRPGIRLTLVSLNEYHGAPRTHFCAVILRSHPAMLTQAVLDTLFERTGEAHYLETAAVQCLHWFDYVKDSNRPAEVTVKCWPPNPGVAPGKAVRHG